VRKHNEAIAKKLLKKKLWGQVINEYLEQLIEVEKLAKWKTS